MGMKRFLAICLFTPSLLAANLTFVAAPGAKSIEEAVADARRDRKPGDSVTIEISGIHRLARPLVLTEADSNLTLTSKGNAELSGGCVISNWRRVAGSELWETEIPEARDGQWIFRQLFVNGERRQRARTPNEGFFRIQGPSPQDKPIKLKFKRGDIKKEWADDGEVEVIGLINWADFRMQIRSVDEANLVATLAGDPRPSNREDNAKYYIENAPDALDSAGEWYLNRKSGVLRYWPKAGEDMTKVEVIAPLLHQLISIHGNAETKKAAEKITLRGLKFSHTDYTLGTNGVADTQAAVAIRGDILFEFANDCMIENCVLAHFGGYGIEAGSGAKNIKVRRCEIVDMGGGGVRIGETSKRNEPFDENHSNVVTDSHLHQLGRVFAPAVGVFILQSGTNLVSHNEINDLFYTAVSVGWNWGYQETPCRRNVVEDNHMHDIGQGILSDMGAVYTLGIQRGTIIRNNLIHDVKAAVYGGWGLYTDEGSSDILLENNVVYRCKHAGFHQHYGRDNVIRNNIFALNTEHQLMRSREEDHNSFTFEKNIVYYNSGDLLGSTWSNDHFTLDRNVYFDARPNASVEKMFKGGSFADWQKRGHDTNSVVADPQFENVAKLDFRLKPTSPALKLGFKPIDLSTVGPRK